MTFATVPTSQAHPLYAPNRACVACRLREGCAGPVPGVGPVNGLPLSPSFAAARKAMFIGEGPGKREDETGEPFTGQTGTYLNSLLESIGLTREQVYLTNLVKCRPTNNRDPKPEEVQECAHRWLQAEILMVRPDIIVTLGAFATRYITGIDDTMEHLHGKPLQDVPLGAIYAFPQSVPWTTPVVLPIYHPASALHAAGGEGGTARMRQVQDDFNVLKALMKGADPASFTPVDQHPNPTYIKADAELLRSFVATRQHAGDTFTLALDTEVVDGALWSVQVASKEGEAILLHAPEWEKWLSAGGGFGGATVVLHNYPYDAQWVDLSGVKVMDTQVMAYLLGLPQSLKTLARDLCGMEMKSYDETVKPYRREKALEYLTEAAAVDWGDPEPITDMKWNNKEGRLLEKIRKSQPINKKITRILKDAAKELDPADPWERWHKIDARERACVESPAPLVESIPPLGPIGMGDMPDAGVNDLSPEEELNYSARDADATLRVYNALRPLITEAGLDQVLEMDLGILPIIREQMNTGMPVNVPYLQELSAQFTEAMYQKAEEASFKAGLALGKGHNVNDGLNIPHFQMELYRFNPGSSHQVARLLYNKVDGLGYPVTKKTDTGLPSTDDDELHKVGSNRIGVSLAGVTSQVFEMDPVIQPILDYRENAKLKGTYSDGLQRLATRSPSGTRVHADMTTTRSETGRIIVKDGIHGIPVRTELGRQIRTAFEAEEGWTLLAVDYCLAPSTRILKRDFEWVPIESLNVGDELWGIDENPKQGRVRKMRAAVVEAKGYRTTDCYRLTLDNGAEIVASGEHPWLARPVLHNGQGYDVYQWVKTKDLSSRWQIWKFAEPWSRDETWAGGYLAGAFDGEGSLVTRRGSNLSFTQREGRMLTLVEQLAHEAGFNFHEPYVKNGAFPGSRPTSQIWLTQRSEIARFLGTYRPVRLLQKSTDMFEGREPSRAKGRGSRKNMAARVVSVEPVGSQRVVSLRTSTHTFIAEGFFTHNSQIEMRVAHHIFQCAEGIKIFLEGRDIHSETAAQINGCTIDQVNADEYGLRRPAKTLGFGVLFGLTEHGMHNQMVFEGHDPDLWSPDNCKRFIVDYFKLYPELQAGHDSIKAAGRRYGYVVDMWGRRRFTPELKSPIRRIRLAGERQAINFPVQAGAQGIIKLAMVKMWQRWHMPFLAIDGDGVGYGDPPKDSLRWLIQYHDELIFEAKLGTELAWAAILVEVMESVVNLSIPIIAEAKHGQDWGHMSKIAKETT